MCRGAQQRPKLGLEDRWLREAEPDSPQPGMTRALGVGEPARIERGVDERPRNLPFVDVERSNRDRPWRHVLDDVAIHLVLFVLARKVGRTADEQKLRSIKP